MDLVFVPSTAEVYPQGFDTYVDVGSTADRLEGSSRPGHFRGVATVVCKLLSMVRPDRAYFGQKDAQQCLVIKRLNADLNLGAEIVAVPTVATTMVWPSAAATPTSDRKSGRQHWCSIALSVSRGSDGTGETPTRKT